LKAEVDDQVSQLVPSLSPGQYSQGAPDRLFSKWRFTRLEPFAFPFRFAFRGDWLCLLSRKLRLCLGQPSCGQIVGTNSFSSFTESLRLPSKRRFS
jgi:hypothetical protein